MSEDAGWDPNWWRQAKETSLARRAAKPRAASAAAGPGDAFLIVTEGVVTEPVYFEQLLARLPLPSVRVKVMPGDASDPRHVVKTADREAKEQVRRARKGQLAINEPPKFDQVWAVIDTDVAVRNGVWNDVVQLAAARRVRLAHSTPCIEFWFLLHIAGYTTRGDLSDGAAAKAAVKAALGRDYSTNRGEAREAIGAFIEKWPEAVDSAGRVRRHHQEAATPSPGNPSTEVDRLVRALNDALPAPQRLLPLS